MTFVQDFIMVLGIPYKLHLDSPLELGLTWQQRMTVIESEYLLMVNIKDHSQVGMISHPERTVGESEEVLIVVIPGICGTAKSMKCVFGMLH
jgi:hypothetical protein